MRIGMEWMQVDQVSKYDIALDTIWSGFNAQKIVMTQKVGCKIFRGIGPHTHLDEGSLLYLRWL